MSDKLTTAAEVGGALLITVGASLIALSAGFIVAGAFLIAFGYLGSAE